MTVMFNVAEAKAKLSELIARAEAGEEVVIARGGKAAVVLKPAEGEMPKRRRQPGAWAKYGPAEDPELFLRPDPELEALMEAPIWPKE
jgi:prevent-host-death family protein